MSNTNVSEWYTGKNIFITGSTGFLGVCLLEKILRSIPNTGEIYLLLRPKSGKDIQERLEEIKKNSVFEKLRETKSMDELFSKIKAVAGDVGQPNLGISDEDRRTLVEKVNVIFHSAALLDFANTLKMTVDVNLLGTRRVLELGRQCRNLSAFVHVSSAYVNSYKLHAEEIVYPHPKNADEIIALTEKLPDSELIEKTTEILGEHINTYTFTKHLAEIEVQKNEENFPCTIVRPSMIVGSWNEPIPGWTISKNGPQGFLMGAAKGVIRRLPVGKKLIYDYIPVDIVINHLIVAGFHAGLTKTKKVEVYQCTSSTRNPFRWADVEDKVNFYLHKYPLNSAVWYPNLKFLPSLTLYKISAIFVHIIPAMILDTVTRITGGRPILMKLHRNVGASLNRLEKFVFTEWTFPAEKTEELQKWLSFTDQKDFNIDISSISWRDYFDDLSRGARVYLNKEPLKNLPAAKVKDKILLAVHLLFKISLMCLVWYVYATIFNQNMRNTAFVVPIVYILLSII